MAISYTVSYTFSPSTTISSSQVNTNTSDVANTFVGIEAKTKTFSNLGVDAELKSGGTVKSADGLVTAPSFTFTSNTALGLYLSGTTVGLVGLNAWTYRRPVLQYSSGTVVNLETGINGTSGQAQILFPDGTVRNDSTSGRINCNLAQNAVLSGSAQSGLRTGSQTANTWYSFYAVKVTDSSTNFVTVADTLFPTQANYASLNSNFGTNGWVYLGTLPNGDNSGATNVILKFSMEGNFVKCRNTSSGNTISAPGIRLATLGAAASTLTYTYAAGGTISSAQTPAHILLATIVAGTNTTTGNAVQFTDSASNFFYHSWNFTGGTETAISTVISLQDGMKISQGTANNKADIFLTGYWDGVLGIGANPLL